MIYKHIFIILFAVFIFDTSEEKHMFTVPAFLTTAPTWLLGPNAINSIVILLRAVPTSATIMKAGQHLSRLVKNNTSIFDLSVIFNSKNVMALVYIGIGALSAYAFFADMTLVATAVAASLVGGYALHRSNTAWQDGRGLTLGNMFSAAFMASAFYALIGLSFRLRNLNWEDDESKFMSVGNALIFFASHSIDLIIAGLAQTTNLFRMTSARKDVARVGLATLGGLLAYSGPAATSLLRLPATLAASREHIVPAFLHSVAAVTSTRDIDEPQTFTAPKKKLK